MHLYPAIDLRDGKCVRLRQGDYSDETVYDDAPVSVARAFEERGAQWIHVVDLDAARDGGSQNLGAIEGICAAVSCNVQTGGGVRSVEDAADRFAAGVARVVVGSAAIEHPDLVGDLATLHPGRVVVGLDVRGREVATRGWARATGLDVVTLATGVPATGVAALVVTQIAVDGMLTGPDLDLYALLLASAELPVIASGGVGSLDDLRALARIEAGGRMLAGVIVGKAIYERRFTLEEGLVACSP